MARVLKHVSKTYIFWVIHSVHRRDQETSTSPLECQLTSWASTHCRFFAAVQKITCPMMNAVKIKVPTLHSQVVGLIYTWLTEGLVLETCNLQSRDTKGAIVYVGRAMTMYNPLF